MIIHKAYRVRLYPNKAQEQHLVQIIGACRFVYNHYLDLKTREYREDKKHLSHNKMSADLTQMRHETEWLSVTQVEPLQQALRRLDVSFRDFFKKKTNYPTFKSKKDFRQSFQKHKDWRMNGRKIKIQQDLIVKFRGIINPNAKLGTLVVSKVGKKWFASITAKEEVKTPKRYTKPIGIDVGLTTLATLSNSKKYPNIQPQKALQERLTAAQRALARKQKGSNRRQKAKLEVGRLYEKIRNVRANHLHQVSKEIVSKNHAMIAVEDLNVKGMMANRKLSRAFGDASVSELLRQIKYKQGWKGGEFVKVGRYFPSSKTCHACGFYREVMPLSVRKWKCPSCKKSHDRDVNAAKNILLAAYAMRGEAR